MEAEGLTLPYMFYASTRNGRVSLRGGPALLEYALMHSDEAEAARDCVVHGGGAVLGVGLPPDGRTTDFPG